MNVYEYLKFTKRIDFLILISVLFLISWGVLNIYSASINEYTNLYLKQLIFGVVSVLILIVFIFIDYRKILNYSIHLYIIGIASLVFVKFFGITILGAKRWINLGFINLQPSEFMKFIVLMVVAFMLENKSLPISIKDAGKIFAVALLPSYLTLIQPDLGTALTIMFPVLFIVFLAEIDKKYIIGALTTVIALSPFVWNHLKDYQKNRILAFINPDADPLGSAYHILQSKIAIGSGMIFGKGYLHGTQSKLSFLPEQHTDFIFATIGEEWGFVVSFLLITIYLVLVLRIFYWGSVIKNLSGKFICYGAGGLIFLQSFINIAMTLGFAPVVGITLPFLSYGGSSLLTFSLIIGLVLSVVSVYKKERLQF